MSKYNPLKNYLRGLPGEDRQHELSLAEIEGILGVNLPHTARIDRPWWANTRSSPQGIHWLDAGWKVDRVDLNSHRIRFVRTGAVAETSKPTRNRYEKLRRFFASVPSPQLQIALTFNELAVVLGGNLPKSAIQDRAWWANTKSSPQGLSWMTVGWRVEKVFLGGRIVTFRRKGDNSLKNISRYVEDLLDGSAHLGGPAPSTLAGWIRFCKRVGWYFEATVLYERGGLNTDLLGECECAEIHEDYIVCKRELSRYRDKIDLMIERNPHGQHR